MKKLGTLLDYLGENGLTMFEDSLGQKNGSTLLEYEIHVGDERKCTIQLDIAIPYDEKKVRDLVVSEHTIHFYIKDEKTGSKYVNPSATKLASEIFKACNE